MVKYIIIHNKHEGCYDFQYYEDAASKMRLTSITINPPKIFMFETREQAQDFFEEYINDVDVIDIRCKKGEDVKHINYCTCGIIELDEEENPILFYNKKNQIFLMEHGPQVFLPSQELKNDIKNLNLTNRLIRKCKTLAKEQRKRYIELGKYCEECSTKDDDDDEEEEEDLTDKDLNQDKDKQDQPTQVNQPTHVNQVNQPTQVNQPKQPNQPTQVNQPNQPNQPNKEKNKNKKNKKE